MKSIKVIVIGFIFAVALVAWPAGYMQYITAGIGFLLAAVLSLCQVIVGNLPTSFFPYDIFSVFGYAK